MSPDPLSPAQREALDIVLEKQARALASKNMRVADQIELWKDRAVGSAKVAFVALCLAAIFLMLFIRARGTKTTEAAPASFIYCALKGGEWICEADLSKLEAEIEPPAPASSYGTSPTSVEL